MQAADAGVNEESVAPERPRSRGREVGQAPQRAAEAARWLDKIPKRAGQKGAFLVTDRQGNVFVHDRGHRRAVTSPMLASALEQVLGPPTVMARRRIDRWPKGAPVEVLEGRRGRPVVVVGAQRLPLRGLPLPHPVRQRVLDRLPEGPTLDLGRAVVPRAKYDAARVRARQLAAAATPGGMVRRARRALSERGVVGVARSLLQRAWYRAADAAGRKVLY